MRNTPIEPSIGKTNVVLIKWIATIVSERTRVEITPRDVLPKAAIHVGVARARSPVDREQILHIRRVGRRLGRDQVVECCPIQLDSSAPRGAILLHPACTIEGGVVDIENNWWRIPKPPAFEIFQEGFIIHESPVRFIRVVEGPAREGLGKALELRASDLFA